MALVPTLASMAALTLLQHPEHQPEGVSVDYTPFRQPAILIQRFIRNVRRRTTAALRLTSAARGSIQRSRNERNSNIIFGVDMRRLDDRNRRRQAAFYNYWYSGLYR